MPRGLGFSLSVLAVLTVAGLVPANHPQYASTDRVAFVHKGGNDWWVEVDLVGPSEKNVVMVVARDDNDDWRKLALRSWGHWAGSFHIEPGNRVRFAAVFDDGTAYSCQFTHPTGMEQCNENMEFSVWPGGLREFALFNHRGGNSGWVVVGVEVTDVGAHADSVEARVEGSSTLHRLEQQPGGDWAGPVPVAPGKRIQFEAYQAGGMSHVWFQRSCWFTHPEGDEQCTGGVGRFMEAEFRPTAGNEWWVQVRVDSSKPLSGVHARVGDTGTWMPLAKKSWGDWAASFHVPQGSLVEFRARSTDGFFDLSEGAWRWPTGEPVPAPGPLEIRYSNLRGNQWWVGVNVAANEPIVNVVVSSEQCCVTDSLRPQDWGDWAGTLHTPIPAGSRIQLFAYSVDGQESTTDWMPWPPP